jgi:hypothetical protein
MSLLNRSIAAGYSMSLLNVSVGGWIQYVVTECVSRRLDTVCRY